MGPFVIARVLQTQVTAVRGVERGEVLPDVRELRSHQLREPRIAVIQPTLCLSRIRLSAGDTRRQEHHEKGSHGPARISYPGIPCQRRKPYTLSL